MKFSRLAILSLIIAYASTACCTVVINEIMFKPQTGAPEWVELFNTGDTAVTLTSWTLTDSARTNILPAITIHAHDFLIAAASTIDCPCTSAVLSSFVQLNNTGDNLYLLDATGAPIDVIHYTASSSWDYGLTIERVSAYTSGEYATNWQPCTDAVRHTACATNSCTILPIDLAVISLEPSPALPQSDAAFDITAKVTNLGEVSAAGFFVYLRNSATTLADSLPIPTCAAAETVEVTFSLALPAGIHNITAQITDTARTNNALAAKIFVGAEIKITELYFSPNDGDCEWVELYNTSGYNIELDAWSLCDPHTCATLPSEFIIADTSFAIVAACDITASCTWHCASPFPTLNDTGDEIVLRTPSGAVATSALYNSSAGDRGISAELSTIQGDSYYSCRAENGNTMCENNSLWAAAPSADITFSCNPFDPTYCETCTFYVAASAEASVETRLYDIYGHLVVDFGEGTQFTWSGVANNEPVRNGTYIFVAEITENSNLKHIKRSFIVARNLAKHRGAK